MTRSLRMSWQDGGDRVPAAPGQGARNRYSLLRVVLIVTFCAIGALFVPAYAFEAVFGSFLMVAAVVAAFSAVSTRDRPMARHLTRWDEAALFLVLGGIATMLADPAASRSALSLLP